MLMHISMVSLKVFKKFFKYVAVNIECLREFQNQRIMIECIQFFE